MNNYCLFFNAFLTLHRGNKLAVFGITPQQSQLLYATTIPSKVKADLIKEKEMGIETIIDPDKIKGWFYNHVFLLCVIDCVVCVFSFHFYCECAKSMQIVSVSFVCL